MKRRKSFCSSAPTEPRRQSENLKAIDDESIVWNSNVNSLDSFSQKRVIFSRWNANIFSASAAVSEEEKMMAGGWGNYLCQLLTLEVSFENVNLTDYVCYLNSENYFPEQIKSKSCLDFINISQIWNSEVSFRRSMEFIACLKRDWWQALT